jgi:hypothetical protein
MRIRDDDIRCVYVCGECGHEAEVTPDYFQNNGTPICCDQDMVYGYTRVAVAINIP